MQNRFKMYNKVRIVNGQKTAPRPQYYLEEIVKNIGKIYEIMLVLENPENGEIEYILRGCNPLYSYTEDWLEPAPDESIVICRNGQEVTAYDEVNKRKGVAKCHPKDEFDFQYGARLALQRLMENRAKANEGFFTGKAVCVKPDILSGLTAGKVYEFVNGYSHDDFGYRFPMDNEGFRDLQDPFIKIWGDFAEVVD